MLGYESDEKPAGGAGYSSLAGSKSQKKLTKGTVGRNSMALMPITEN